MGIFEVEAGGKVYEVDAPDIRAAVNAVRSNPDIGQGRALLEGLRSGLTANFGDEMAGVAAAAQRPKDLQNPFSGASDFLTGLGKLGYGALTGEKTASDAYAKRRDEVRAVQKSAEEQYPITNIGGQILGSVAVPLGAALRAPSIGERMLRGAGVGAGFGGLSGLGEGQTVEDRATRAAAGTVLGGAVGALGVPVVEGAVKGIGALASKPLNMLRSGMNPEGGAERAIGRAYREAVEADPNAVNRLAQSELQPGAPQTVLDVLGGPGRDLARSAGNLSGGARDTLNATLDERFANQTGRMTDWFRRSFNYPDVHAQQQAIETASKGANSRAYLDFYKATERGLWSPELERLTGSPAVVEAMRTAATNGKNRAIADKMGGFNAGVTFDNGLVNFRKGPNGVPTFPNGQFWDYTYRELRDAADKAFRSGANSEGNALKSLSTQLRAEIDNLATSPNGKSLFKEARSGAAAFFNAENALEAGQKFVMENFSIPQTRAALAKMTPQERQLFQDGFVSRYIETLEKVGDRADVTRRIYNTPEARQKIEMVLGAQKAGELEAAIRIENIMQQGLRAVQGNSSTVLQSITAGLAGAGGGGFLGFDPTTSGIVSALAMAGKRGIDQKVAQRVAEMLTSNDPAIINRGVRMIANNRRMMDALRSADSAAARVGGGQSAIPISGPQLPVPSRADDE